MGQILNTDITSAKATPSTALGVRSNKTGNTSIRVMWNKLQGSMG